MTCSIDNLTILSTLKDKRQFQAFVNSTGTEYIKAYRSNPDVYPYCDFWTMTDGSCLQYASDSAAKVPPIRFEFNPNKCNIAETMVMLSFMDNRRPSRIDVAIDFNEDLSKHLWLCPGMKSTRFYSRSSQLETLYYGSRSSAMQYRIYDKAVEQKTEGRVWWRVESQSRFKPNDDNYLPEDLFANLYAIPEQQESIVNRALVLYLRAYPEQLPDLTRWHRAKLIESTVGAPLNVNAVYLTHREDLQNRLNLWLDN